MEKLLLADEVASLLRVNKDRVYQLARDNQIPHVRVGRQVRFQESALKEWLSNGGSNIAC
jgi:excisionase family DNA binding protein